MRAIINTGREGIERLDAGGATWVVKPGHGSVPPEVYEEHKGALYVAHAATIPSSVMGVYRRKVRAWEAQ